MFVVDNKTVVYLTGARRGASACLPSDAFDPVKGLAMAYMRALGQTVDDIRIEINPKQNAPQEDKPLTCEGCKYGDRVIQDAQINKPLTFEVGEMVKFRDDLIGGKEYDRMTYCDGMKNDFPKTFALPKPNSVGNCCLKGWHFPLTMLEKVPQSTKHGLKEAWEEVKRWADSALYAEWKDSHDRH
jgi:hypothetical protein